MHCSSFEVEGSHMEGGEILVAIAALVKEGRIPGKSACSASGFHEGPHCMLSTTSSEHSCNSSDPLCLEYEKVRSEVLELWQRGIPLCVEVLLIAGCACKEEEMSLSPGACETEAADSGVLVEQWFINISHRRVQDKTHINLPQLLNAVRSQLHFSQISSWLSNQQKSSKISLKNIAYHLSVPGETIKLSQFTSSAHKHDFPTADIGNGLSLQVSLLSLPRLPEMPSIKCNKCEPVLSIPFDKIQINPKNVQVVDDRMHTSCTLKGKHRCEDYDEPETALNRSPDFSRYKRVCQFEPTYYSQPSTSTFVQTSKLNMDIQKEPQNINCFRMESGCSKLRSELNSNDKRIICQNKEQRFKNPKLDIDKSTCKEFFKVECNTFKLDRKTDEKFREPQSKGDILLNAILRSSQSSSSNILNKQSSQKYEEGAGQKCDFKCVQKLGDDCRNSCANALKRESDNNSSCDNLSASGDIFSIKNRANFNYLDKHCDSPIPKIERKTVDQSYPCKARQRITFRDKGDDCDEGNDMNMLLGDEYFHENNSNKSGKEVSSMGVDIPSAQEQAKFRKSLDSATSMVFHTRTGLPLTSSPAPIRKGKSCFDFDSSITSVSAIGNALFSLVSDDDSESDGSIVSPCSPNSYLLLKREPVPEKCSRGRHPNNLLGTFEESVLNGRLEPVSTVHGFTAELGASGSFVPKHLVVPVTVFFYNLGDNDKVSSSYLGHINLGKKGYQVPKCGTVQLTLFNPLGTVVKMFVIMYDLKAMPPCTQTFLRQRTLYMPTDCNDSNLEWDTKWLRYLIHLRFMSSKSGRIYLHSDIRIIICCKTDLDTATAHGMEMSYELRSFTHMPTNPQFCPRK